MARVRASSPTRLRLCDIATRRPASGADCAAMALGGTTLYASNAHWLNQAVDKIQRAIELGLEDHLLLVRNQIDKQARERLGEKVGDRVLGAVLGRALRLGISSVMPCLTINGRILRMYIHEKKRLEINKKLNLLEGHLAKKTGITVDTAQLLCFPKREPGTKFMARQLLSHLAYEGRVVFVDEDLFTSPLQPLKDALWNHRK